MSTHGRIRTLKTVMAVLTVVAFFGSPIADPTVTDMPPVFCFRITDIADDKTDAEGDRFTFLFEVLNWSDNQAGGVYISLNNGTGVGGVSGARPFISSATVDENGRQIGPGSDPPPGNRNPINTWDVTMLSTTKALWNAGSPVDNLDLVGAFQNEQSPCDLVPGCQSQVDPQGNLQFVIPDPETIDDAENVQDGFQVVIDDFDVGEIVSFNWFLFDTNGQPIGTAALGNSYGFGEVNIGRIDGGPVAGPLFTGNTGMSQSPMLFYDGVYIVPDPAEMAAEFGPSLTASFLDPGDNFINAPVNATLAPQSQADFFANSAAEIELETTGGQLETISLAGTSALNFVAGPNGEARDADGNGRDEVLTLVEQLELVGNSPTLGEVHVRLRRTNQSPFLRSFGETEEFDNAIPSVLELPPYSASGTAESSLNLYYEIEFNGQILHNKDAQLLDASITNKPPAQGETYGNSFALPLFDDNNDSAHVTVLDFLYTPVSNALICNLVITSPANDLSICDSSVPVVAKLTVMGGNPPYNDTTCTINGIPSTVQADGTLMAFVPLIPGVNTIVAECRVIDLGRKAALKVPEKRFEEAVCQDSVKVFSDPTPPTCTFDFSNLPIITGQAIDNESGIAVIEVVETRNRIVTIDPFTPGDNVVGFSSDKIDPSLPSGFMLKVTNVAGCDTICDPIYLRLNPTDTPCHFTFALPHTDRYFYITNRGLERVFLTINGHELNLVASQSGSGRDGNTYFMPFEGTRAIDLADYLIAGENQFEVICQGEAGAYADLLILDFEMQDGTTSVDDSDGGQGNPPTGFALDQNYPNPFNPNTRIAFAMPDAGEVSLIIYDIQGNEVKMLASGSFTSGMHEVTWDGRNRAGEAVSAGTYIYRLLVTRKNGQAEVVLTRKMTFLK